MKIYELTTVLSSKSAGPFRTTFDLFFDEDESYKRVKDSGVLTKERIADLYNMKPDDVFGIFFVDSIRGIKITIPKPTDMASGAPRCRDLFGAQQHIPLMELDIP
ncbi:DUF4387 domain-containing protein [Thermodesulfobacteriota bacterium]